MNFFFKKCLNCWTGRLKLEIYCATRNGRRSPLWRLERALPKSVNGLLVFGPLLGPVQEAEAAYAIDGWSGTCGLTAFFGRAERRNLGSRPFSPLKNFKKKNFGLRAAEDLSGKHFEPLAEADCASFVSLCGGEDLVAGIFDAKANRITFSAFS